MVYVYGSPHRITLWTPGQLGITLTPFQIRVFWLGQALIPKKAGLAHTYYSQKSLPLFSPKPRFWTQV